MTLTLAVSKSPPPVPDGANLVLHLYLLVAAGLCYHRIYVSVYGVCVLINIIVIYIKCNLSVTPLTGKVSIV